MLCTDVSNYQRPDPGKSRTLFLPQTELCLFQMRHTNLEADPTLFDFLIRHVAYGTSEDIEAVIKGCHERGLKIICDLGGPGWI